MVTCFTNPNLLPPKQKWVDGFTPPAVLLDDFAKDLDKLPQSNLLVVITTDRGLCGGVNSSLARMLKQIVPKLHRAKKDVQLFIIGDKGRAQLGRPLGEFITQVRVRARRSGRKVVCVCVCDGVTE